MQRCPHCNIDTNIRKLPHQGLFKVFRICPNCGGYFTVDAKTKNRQAVFIFILLISTVFTVLMYSRGMEWLIPSLFSYIILGILMYWGNKQLFFVPYEKDKDLR